MTVKQIYAKTLPFSLLRFLWDVIAFAILGGLTVLGFIIAEKTSDDGLIGLLIGFVVGVIIVAIMMRFVSYNFKAGQIAMMTRGITTGELPENVVKEGAKAVKSRFATVALFFGATRVIKGIFNEIGNAIMRVGKAIGGDTGNAVGSAISAVIQVIVAYLCDCCLGWVFFRAEQKPVRATLEGSVLFFKHGKTFAKNMGRVFGLGLVSFLLIGGLFAGGFLLVFIRIPDFFHLVSAELVGFPTEIGKEVPEVISKPDLLMVISTVIGGIILWSILHSVFVKPFILTGVLKNYLESGMKDIPTEQSFAALDSKSKKFAKLHRELYA